MRVIRIYIVSDMHIRVVMMCIRANRNLHGRCVRVVSVWSMCSLCARQRAAFARACWPVCSVVLPTLGRVHDRTRAAWLRVLGLVRIARLARCSHTIITSAWQQSRHSHYTLNWRGLRSQHSGCMALACCSMCVATINTRNARNCSYRNHRSTIMIRTRNRNRNCRYDIGFVAEILSISLPVILVVISACVADGVTDSVFV